ncbi:hypothetical protein JKA74_02035 [Marivirga sp. S37H4]|uniref:Bacterial surface antigen (D15) domain-containing protein n=1 Tax=Marivirga aurantiaca TaxID=2802615 RepID=A0A935C5E2_9BACT|nr:hypothetical protein [Marivirga aurantiaca]MBK6263801.1 hypothetical protein [Marivirga aurantiaca]
MKFAKFLLLTLILGAFGYSADAQFRRSSANKTVTYEELYNDPYDINKLFIGITPLYGDVHVTNITTGFGVDATYYLNDFMHFKANARTPYYSGSDFARNAANKSDGFDGRARNYFHAEVSGAYHIWDKEQESKSMISLYSKNYKGAQWAAKVPQRAEIPNKRREILFARLGGVYYETTSELSRAIAAQGIEVVGTATVEGEEFTHTLSGESDNAVYGNVIGYGVSVGGGFTWMKNFAAKPDKTYEELVDDHVLSTFLDLFIFPVVKVEDFFHNPDPVNSNMFFQYNGEDVNTFMFGGRLGIEGHFNRTLGWGYGAELGVRPGLEKRGFYGLIKITFPLYGTKLDYKVEAFGR